jgi:hypothetical protein
VKKILYLFLALLLPGLIFVFLKYAGRNEFTIPSYYDTGVSSAPGECGLTYPVPYRIRARTTGASVILFPAAEEDGIEDRLSVEFPSRRLEIVRASTQWPADSLTWAKKCYYLTNDPYNTVLVDSAGAIRGYYDVRLRDEEDRLRVELKILLKQY